MRSVDLHRAGKVARGTLTLTRHHLIFTYRPDSTAANVQSRSAQDSSQTDLDTSSQPGLSTQSSTLTAGSAESVDTTRVREDHALAKRVVNGTPLEHTADAQTATPKARSHNVQRKSQSRQQWFPYPLINHCILRPSHSQSHAQRSQTSEIDFEAKHDEGDLFPPTYGTSSLRPSTDSARIAPYSSPHRPSSPVPDAADIPSHTGSGRQPSIRIRCKDFITFALHFHQSACEKTPDEEAREVFFALRSRCCVENVEELPAFQYQPPSKEASAGRKEYDARREFARMGISGKAADGPGAAWRLTDINHDYTYSPTYPAVLGVPKTVSDNMLKYGGSFRSKARIPALAYLHSNGGSITRSSQPMVGVQGKRNPQDERLVSAIFSSHTPPLLTPEDSPPQVPSLTSPSTTTLESGMSDPETANADVPSLPITQTEIALDEKVDDKATPLRKKIYGSTRRNLIVDARPKINMLANRATGGGIEDVANYMGTGEMPVEKVFLNIANIHVMRASLEKIVESLGNTDYLNLPPNQEALRKSGWLGHIAGVLDGAEMVARVIGLGGSHVLIHCSDGWDRTSQVAALAQVMLDPFYRTLEGIITLIQKDFLAFGHKFRDRNGIEGSERWFEIENERIQPTRTRDQGVSGDSNSLNALGSKALSGARSWFEKNRGGLFKQQNSSHDSLVNKPSSRPTSPPPNPIIHSPPASTSKTGKRKMDEKEIAPIFHQFLDATYQLMHQNPKAFEYNERFLRKLLYQVYACHYGEFLFNNERERSQHPKLPSVWSFFLWRRAEFTNPDFVAKVDDPLLFPQRQGHEREPEVRWWNELFGQEDKHMNVPQALASPDPPSLPPQFGSSVSLDDGIESGAEKDATASAVNGSIRAARSTPSLSSTVRDSVASSFSSLRLSSDVAPRGSSSSLARPPMQTRETDFEVLEKYSGSPQPATATNGAPAVSAPTTTAQALPLPVTDREDADEGDPLGVSKSVPQAEKTGRLDFAAFAQQNAFRDR